jgi:hypothetical protein
LAEPSCYAVTVALRYTLLAAGAVALVGVSVYLFFEVRARPAQAGAVARVAPPAAAARESERVPAPVREALPTQAAPAPGEARGRERPPAEPPRREPPRGPDGEPLDPTAQKLEAVMSEANKAYDRGDLDDAKSIARKVLAVSPNNVRMLRIVVSASCIAGDTGEAQAAYVQLPKPDREQMKTRCARYGVSFTDP